MILTLLRFCAKRRLEVKTKMSKTAEETLGKMRNQMVSLDSIATTPEKQGHGYGTALGKIVTAAVGPL